jgi:lipopolysaccharide export system permease protein
MTISFWAAPWGKRAFRTTLYDITRKQVSIGLQPQVFMKKFSNLVLYANTLDERSGAMKGIFIVQQEPENPMLIIAESGLVQSDPLQQAVTLQLHNGVIHRQKTGSREDRYQVIGFTTYEISPDLSKSLAGAARPQRLKTNQMAVDELWVMAGAGADLNWVARGELHSRLCAPLAPLIFALFALPFSIFSQRSGRSGGFVVGLLIYVIYYFFTSLAETLTVEGHITPLLTFWIPHLLLVIAGGYLLRQGALERPAPLMAWIDRGMFRIRQFRERHADH